MNSKQNLNLAILRANIFTPGYGGRWGLPVLLWGDPGIGKTAGVSCQARDAGLDGCEGLIGSTLDPADIGGYPVPDPSDLRFVRPLLPAFVRRLEAFERGGILLIDELTTVPPLVQAALLGVALDGRIGHYKLDPRIRIIAAANPVELAVNGTPLAPPTSNRFCHLTWQNVDLDVWADILRGDHLAVAPIDAAEREAAVLAAWPEAFESALALVHGFLSRKPELRQATPLPGDDSPAWPSSRTWEFAVRVLASCKVHGLCEDARDLWLAGTVGGGAAVEFAAWLRDADLPDPRALLDGTATWEIVAHRPDRTSAVLASVLAVIKADKAAGDPLYSDRFKAAAKVVGDAGTVHRDFASRVGLALFGVDAGQAARAFGRDIVSFREFSQATGIGR